MEGWRGKRKCTKGLRWWIEICGCRRVHLVDWSGFGEGAETKVDAGDGKMGLEGEGEEAEIFIPNTMNKTQVP